MQSAMDAAGAVVVVQVPVPPDTTRNLLIYDEIFMTVSENVIDLQVWAPSPKTVTFYQFRHDPAQNTVTFK